jgi:hypothetical protein
LKLTNGSKDASAPQLNWGVRPQGSESVDLQMRVWKTGTWLYDGSVPVVVRIISLNWDPLWEEGYDPDPPYLNAEGWAYSLQLRHTHNGAPAVFSGAVAVEMTGAFARTAKLLELDRFQFPRAVGLTLDEAIQAAEALLEGEIRWASSDAPAA